MTTSRLRGRRGDGSAVVRGWVACYTLGLPGSVRARRRDEVAGDLADETLDAVRRGETGDLRRQRLVRWVSGIPDDLMWRISVAPSLRPVGSTDRGDDPWSTLTRTAFALLLVVGIGAAGALTLVSGPLLSGQAGAEVWPGWGPYGFVVACTLVLVAVPMAVPWPGRSLAVGLPAIGLGMVASPWLWGCWCMVLIALLVRWFQAHGHGSSIR